MRIVRHDERVLELRGRDQSGERGSGGIMSLLGLIIMFAISVFGLIWVLVTLWQITDGFRQIPHVAQILSWAIGVLPVMVLLPAFASVLFSREALILDLRQRKGIYRKWWLMKRFAKDKQFRFDQVDSVTFEHMIEVVSHDEGLSHEYEKWGCKLRLRRRTTIALCKLGNEVKARRTAETVCKALGVELLDKTVDRGAERIAAKDLDRPLAPARRPMDAPRKISLEDVKLPDPPHETTTQLDVDKAAGEIRLEYYMAKCAFGAIIALFFGVIMALVGCIPFWLGPAEPEFATVALILRVVFAVMFIAGLVLIVIAPVTYFSRERLTITPTHVVRSLRLPGHRFFASVPILGKALSRLREQLPLNEIESVRSNTRGNPPRIDVRSDKKILRASKGLVEAEELKWRAAVLRAAIKAMGH